MAERPIIFSAGMVRALLAGTKTQTRRVVKRMNGWTNQDCREARLWHGRWCHFLKGAVEPVETLRLPRAEDDRLWVREAWSPNPRGVIANLPDKGAVYRADHGALPDAGRWRSPIHMPRWASRLTLLVTDVRVQRVQEISRGDALEEGCPFPNMADGPDPRDWFRGVWNSIHGPGAWDANPWVVALTFTVARQNIDAVPDA